MKVVSILISLFYINTAVAHVVTTDPAQRKPVLANLNLLKLANIPVLYSDPQTEIGYTVLTDSMEQKLSEASHRLGHCAGYEMLTEVPQDLRVIPQELAQVKHHLDKDKNYESMTGIKNISVTEKPEISSALSNLKAENIRQFVEWLSSYPTRYNKGDEPNKHVDAMIAKLKDLTKNSTFPITIEKINHKSTQQNSIRLTIKGKSKPQEFIVLGGHLDSINGWGGYGNAPGADDNASGSGSIFEALRVLLIQNQPERSIEFYWYAGEESGLLGSAEIAKEAKAANKNVVAVLQLDMTMFPGDGVLSIASMTDFTSSWLRDYLRAINETYLKITIADDKCGYGCSDHASWYRNGFPTLMPAESKFSTMFPDLHTEKDVISTQMNFEHSLVFAKIALVMSMDLGNSIAQQPY